MRSLRLGWRRVVAVVAGAAAVVLGVAACGNGGSEASGAGAAGGSGSAGASELETTLTMATTTFARATSPAGFDDTVTSVEEAVADAGLTVVRTLDQAAAMEIAGFHMEGAKTLLVGDPTDTAVYRTDPAIGAVTPVRIYVWVDEGGTTQVGYFDPESMFGAVVPELVGTGDRISGLLGQIVAQATGDGVQAGSLVEVGFVTATSHDSFDATVANLGEAISAAGMLVLDDLDQAALMADADLPGGAKTLFVGSPTIGKALFEIDLSAGAVVPSPVYVWVDEGGTTQVGYFDPESMFGAVDPALSDVGADIAQTAAQIVEGAL